MNERGATLLEWTVAMALNLLVLLILTQSLIVARASFSVIDGLARLADNGRFAQDVLLGALSQANQRLACAREPGDVSIQKMDTLQASAHHWLNAPLIGWEAQGTSGMWWSLSTPSPGESAIQSASHSNLHAELPVIIQARIDPQSDVVMVHQFKPVVGGEVIHVSNQEIVTRYPHSLKTCSIVAVTDCNTDLIFQNTHSDPRSLSWSGSACGADHPSVSIDTDEDTWPIWSSLGLYHFERAAWFVGPSDTGTRTLYRALFNRDNEHALIEAMAQHIETLQFEYATQSIAGIQAWQTADQISDWSSVIGVRFAVLVSAPNEKSDDVAPKLIALPTLSGEVMWPSSAGYARVFGSATALRSVLHP